MTKRRSKLQILVDILRAVRKQKGRAKFTHVLYKANLTHKRLKEYLGILLESGFVEEVDRDGRNTYRITRRGEEFLAEYGSLKEFSEAFGIPF